MRAASRQPSASGIQTCSMSSTWSVTPAGAARGLPGQRRVAVGAFARAEVDDLSVHPGTHEPFADHLFEELAVLALSVFHHRGEHHEAGPVTQRDELVHHLLDGLANSPLYHRDSPWAFDMEPDLVPLDFRDGDNDVVTDDDAFVLHAGNDDHCVTRRFVGRMG